MDTNAIKDIIARWESYNDRGIRPNQGWKQGPDGVSCAMGDIFHYLGMEDTGVRRRIAHTPHGLMRVAYDPYRENAAGESIGLTRIHVRNIVQMNDYWGDWPIDYLRGLLDPNHAPVRRERRELLTQLKPMGLIEFIEKYPLKLDATPKWMAEPLVPMSHHFTSMAA